MRKEEKTAVCQYAQIIASSIQVMYSINVRRVEEVLIHHGCCRGRVDKTTPRWSSVIQLKNANTCRLNYIHESLLNWLKDSVQSVSIYKALDSRHKTSILVYSSTIHR